MTRARESKAQLEVWEWKEEAWREVCHLDIRSAIQKRLQDSMETAKRLGPRFRPKPNPD